MTVTLNSKPLLRPDGQPLKAGDLKSGMVVEVGPDNRVKSLGNRKARRAAKHRFDKPT